MKNKIKFLSAFALLSIGVASAQVGVGTTTPATALDVRTTAAADAIITVGDTGNASGALYLGNGAHGLKRGFPTLGADNNVGLYTTAGDVFLSANAAAGAQTATQFVLKQSGNVGIGTATPAANALLDLTSTNKALVLTRVANTAAIATPIDGMIVYDISERCVRFYEGGFWSRCAAKEVVAAGIPTITSVTGRVWMDRDLGANGLPTFDADITGFGDHYQWGRAADGHQIANWSASNAPNYTNGTTATKIAGDTAPDALFVLGAVAGEDWRTTPNNNLWQGEAGINNPCPAGFRVPTNTEIVAEFAAYNITSGSIAFASPFKFVRSGIRLRTGNFANGDIGFVSTTTVSGNNHQAILWRSGTGLEQSPASKTSAMPVRCIKN